MPLSVVSLMENKIDGLNKDVANAHAHFADLEAEAEAKVEQKPPPVPPLA